MPRTQLGPGLAGSGHSKEPIEAEEAFASPEKGRRLGKGGGVPIT